MGDGWEMKLGWFSPLSLRVIMILFGLAVSEPAVDQSTHQSSMLKGMLCIFEFTNPSVVLLHITVSVHGKASPRHI